MTKCNFFIKLLIDIIKALKANCNLTILGIQEKIFFILEVILLIVENKNCQKEIDIYQNLVSINSKNKDML